MKNYTLKFIKKLNGFEIYERHSVYGIKYLVVRPSRLKGKIFGQTINWFFLPQNRRQDFRVFIVDEKEQAFDLAQKMTHKKAA